jgi:hypothetical protein
VGNGATWHWDVLAREAKSSYDQLCFLQAGDPVQPWKRLVSDGAGGAGGGGAGVSGLLGFALDLCVWCFLGTCCVVWDRGEKGRTVGPSDTGHLVKSMEGKEQV